MLEKESLYTVNYYPCKNPIRLQRNSMIQWIRIRILTLSTSYVKTYRWQQTHEQMFNITNNQGNTNQNHNEISSYHLTPFRMAIIKKTINNKCWQKGGERVTLVHFWWECKLVQPVWKTIWRCLQKLKIEPPYDLAILLLGIFLKKTKALILKDGYTPIYVHCSIIYNSQVMEATLVPLMNKLIKKMWYTYTVAYYYAYKKKEIFICDNMDGPKGIMLSEISQREKENHHMISLLCGLFVF